MDSHLYGFSRIWEFGVTVTMPLSTFPKLLVCQSLLETPWGFITSEMEIVLAMTWGDYLNHVTGIKWWQKSYPSASFQNFSKLINRIVKYNSCVCCEMGDSNYDTVLWSLKKIGSTCSLISQCTNVYRFLAIKPNFSQENILIGMLALRILAVKMIFSWEKFGFIAKNL